MGQKRLMDQEALDFLERVTNVLTEQPDLELGISELLDQVKNYLSVEAISLFVIDEPTRTLVLKYAISPASQKLLGVRMPLGQGVVGWVAKYCEALIVPSTALDSRFFSGVDEKTGFVTRSILCVPIVRDGQAQGAIEALNKVAGHFDADDVILLQEIAAAAADYLFRP